MTDVVSAIRHVNDIVGEISAASAEQSAGVGQIAEAITQMDHNTQQNAALVEQSAAAANGLKMQAEQLLQAVSRFRLALQATQPDRAPAAVAPAPAVVRAAPTPRPVPAQRTTPATATAAGAGAGAGSTAAAARPALPRSAPPATSTTDNADWESF